MVVELCAGLAAVTLLSHGHRPPCSRIGSKSGYARSIIEILGIPEQAPALLVEAHPATANGMSWLLGSPQDLAGQMEAMAEGEARQVWAKARELSRQDVTSIKGAAAWWLWTAGARGGIGGFKGRHKLRPSVDGFIPARASLIKRVRGMPVLDVRVVCADARTIEPIPGSVVYIDPPYAGTQGYGRELPRPDVLRLAETWHRAGCTVGVSEREVVDVSKDSHDLTSKRVGQSRRSLTTTKAEWLTVWKDL